ncbi:MAG: hypothetical protein ACXW2C_13285, partial [Acidimicrobiia bacterium]
MDSTVAAVPVYFATMGAEYFWLRKRTRRHGPSPADYERRDTITSLTMGVGSLLAPIVVPRLLGPSTPGRGRAGKVLVASAVGAVVVTTIADRVARAERDEPDGVDPERAEPSRARRRRLARAARKV